MVWILITAYLLSRLVNLLAMPPFIDELIYWDWLNNIKSTHNWLLPLQEFGWAPLTTWFSTVLSYLLKDNLLSLRLTALIFGGLSLLLVYKLSQLLFKNQNISFLILISIILSPLVLIHDRLGLRGDTAVTFSALLLLYGLAKRLLKSQPQASYLIGLAIALGLLIKSTAWIFPLITLTAFLVFRPKLSRHDWLGGLLAGSSLLFYLLTGSLSAFLNKSNVFLVSFNQPGSFARDNLIQIIQWSYQYLSLPLLLSLLFGAFLAFKHHRQIWLLLTSAIVPVLIFDILMAKILFPRYLLFIAVYALFFAGLTLNFLISRLPRYFSLLLLILLFLPNLILDQQIIRDIKQAQLPEIERWQYVTGWPSGYGLADLVSYLQTDTPDILIVEENNLIRSGLPYYWPDHSLNIIVMAENNTLSSDQLTQLSSSPKVYLALNVLETLPFPLKGELIQTFPRPENKTSLKLYRLYFNP